VPPPPPQTSLVAAMLAEILISSAELMPSRLRRYGALDEQAAERLEHLAGQLTGLADTLDVRAPMRS